MADDVEPFFYSGPLAEDATINGFRAIIGSGPTQTIWFDPIAIKAVDAIEGIMDNKGKLVGVRLIQWDEL